MASNAKRTALAGFLGAAIALSGAGIGTASAAQVDLCGALTSLSLADGTTLCTHGNDDQLLPVDSLDAPLAPVTSTALEVVQEAAPVTIAPVTTAAAQLDDLAANAPAAAAASAELDGVLGTSILAPAPAAAAAEGDAPARNAVDGAVPTLPAVCVGSGVDGHRVQVLALHVEGSDITPAADVDLRRWAGQVTWTFMASAERDGAERLVRWVTEPTEDGCAVEITRVSVTKAEVDGFQATIKALDSRGFNRTDRKYLAFVNLNEGICGMGTVPLDDRAGANNAANRTTGYSRIDAPCWTTGDAGFYSVAAHELTHNLGGVQNTAPNASGGYHCTDEWDLMCYADGSSDVSYACIDDNDATSNEGDHFNRLLDCNGDDYFNASMEQDGYLANHWNVADSLFLDGRPEAEVNESTEKAPAPNEEPKQEQAAAPLLVGTTTNLVQTLVNWVVDLVATLTGSGLLRA